MKWVRRLMTSFIQMLTLKLAPALFIIASIICNTPILHGDSNIYISGISSIKKIEPFISP